ncbi:MAG: hypothetical protein S4CHLAM20_08910 [Chlamydiia bacterium]|nr:hypothetical protein [Chlamydiia bacterium]
MLKRSLTIAFLCTSVSLFGDPIVFNTILTPANCTHKLYHPKDKNIPRPYFSDVEIDRKSMTSPTKAVGSGTFLYHQDTKVLEYAISYSNMSSPVVMIHLQVGYAHQDGPIFATLYGRPHEKRIHFSHSKKSKEISRTKMAPDHKYGFLTGSVKLSELGDRSDSKPPIKEQKMLLQGGCYITIHTYLNEMGEIRGQLTPLSTKHLRK